MDLLKELIQHIQDASYILIAGHISPDGDSIGACCALGLMLEQMGKEYAVLMDEPDSKYDYLLEQVTVLPQAPEQQCDLFIALDCGDVDRLGPFKEAHDLATISWNVDHHISNTNYSKYNHVDTKASSASEIVYNIYEASQIAMTMEIAKAIYTGMVTDTARFKHSNTTPRTLVIASKLLEQPFDFSKLVQKLFDEQPFASLQLQGAAIRNIESYYDNALVISTLSLEEIKTYSETGDGAGGIVNTLKRVKDSKVALFLYEKEAGEIKVSMRSEDPYDVSQVAQKFGGGGHKKAAGATIKGTLEETKDQVVSVLKELFQ